MPGFDLSEVRPLAAWAEQILRERGESMKAVEIMVAMTEAGYEMQCQPSEAVKHLSSALAKGAFVFDPKNDSWNSANEPLTD